MAEPTYPSRFNRARPWDGKVHTLEDYLDATSMMYDKATGAIDAATGIPSAINAVTGMAPADTTGSPIPGASTAPAVPMTQAEKDQIAKGPLGGYGAGTPYGVQGGQIGPAPATQGAGAPGAPYPLDPAKQFGPAPLPSNLPSPVLIAPKDPTGTDSVVASNSTTNPLVPAAASAPLSTAAGVTTPGNSIPTGPTGPASTLASNPGMSAGSGAGTMAAGSGAKLPTFGGTGTSTNSGVVAPAPDTSTPTPYAPVTAPEPTMAEAPPANPNGYDPFKPQLGVPGSAMPSSAQSGLTTQAGGLLSQYGQNPLPYPAPSSSTASAPNSTWTGANTAALAQSYNPLPQSYAGAPTGGSSFGGAGGSSGYGGYSAPQFNAPAAPSFGGSGAAGGTTGSATPPVAPTFGATAPTTTSSTQSSSAAPASSVSGYGSNVLAAEEQALAKAGDLQYSQTGQPTTATTSTTDADLAKIAEDYQAAQDKANKANEDRYAQGMQGYGDRYDRNMATEATRTDQDYKDLQLAQDAALASNQQSLTNRGLGNSTIVDTTRAGINDQYAALRNRLGDSRIQTKTALDAGLSGDTLKFLENRTDLPPDLAQLLAMAQLIGTRPKTGAVG